MTTAPAKKTTSPKTPAPKKAPPAKAPARPAAAKAAPENDAGAVAKAARAAKVAKMLRGKDLVARVAEATGAKIKDVRETVEATLSEIGKALDAGEALNLPPLGRVKIAPSKGDGSQPMKLKLRRGAAEKPAKQALAAAGEDS